MLAHLVVLIRALREDSRGLAMVEYAIAGAAIALVAAATFLSLGDAITAVIESIIAFIMN